MKLIRALWRVSRVAGGFISVQFSYLSISNTLKFWEPVQDLWCARNDNMVDLCKKFKEMKGNFLQFQINHVFGVAILSFHYLVIWFKLACTSQFGDLLWKLGACLCSCTKAYTWLNDLWFGSDHAWECKLFILVWFSLICALHIYFYERHSGWNVVACLRAMYQSALLDLLLFRSL